MTLFRTEVNIKPAKNKITYKDQILFIGSCFSENIGRKFETDKFNVLINPFGVLYNPASIEKSLSLIVNNSILSEKDLEFHNGLWYSFNHHSSFSDANAQTCLNRINEKLIAAHDFVKKSSYIIITLGTSWIYELKSKNEIVANCHKLPAKSFHRRLLGIEEIEHSIGNIIEFIRAFNPGCKFIFTVSPVRHLKDGAHENQISKAKLHLAIDHLLGRYPDTSYFPSYEIVMDELRDYRYYSEDMIHINDTAVKFIYEKFAIQNFSTVTLQQRALFRGIVKASQHRSFNPETKAHQDFLQKQLNQLEKINSKYPYLNFSKEEEHFRSELKIQ